MKIRQIYSIDDMDAGLASMERRLKDMQATAGKSRDNTKYDEAKLKRKFVIDMHDELSELNGNNLSIFVSLSHGTKNDHYSAILDKLQEIGFTRILTGFDEDFGSQDKDLKKEIMFRISKARTFLGIWSNDISLEEHGRTAPRVWMPLELGMALIQNKPYSLILHRNTLPSYISPVAEFIQHWYDDTRSLDDAIVKAGSTLFKEINGEYF